MRMPQIDWPENTFEEPAPNRDFMDIKLRHTEDMLYRLRPYADTVFSLTGVRGRQDIKEVVWFVLREFTAFFWDLPASRNYHHSERWGLLHHSLEVALNRAVEASRRVAVDSEGNPSAEAGRKHRGEQVLIAWLTGLFHDSGKIFDIDLVYSGFDRDIYYHPFRGNVLGFKLKFPQPSLSIKWRRNRGMRHARRNLAMFMNLIPLDLLKQFRQDQLIALFDGLIEDGDAADQESVENYRSEEDSEFIRHAIKLFARDNFRAKDNKGRIQPRIFGLGQNTYAMVNPVAIDAIVHYIRTELGGESYTKDQVIRHLIQKRLIHASSEEETSGNFFIQLVGYLKTTRVNFHVIFAHGDLFAEVDVSTLPVFKIEDDPDVRARISRITGFAPPDEWFHSPQPKHPAQKT